MADNVAISAGAGTNIATDDIAGVHYQRVKLMDGTADSAAVIPGDATNGLDVDVTRVIPGTTATALGKAEDDAHNSGDVGVMALAVAKATPALLGADGDYSPMQLDSAGRLWVHPSPVQVRISVTPTISTTPAYTTGDCLGGLQTISNAARVSGGSGILTSVLVLDKTQAQRAAIDLLFFDRSVSVAGDNSPVAMSDGDMANCLGVISIGPYNTAWPGTPLNSISTLFNIGLPFVLNGTDLFCQAVVRAGPTYVATTDLVFIYTILQD
jgi:hypothetical protein